MERDVRKLNEGFKRTGSWVTAIVLTLAALPFLWGAGYMTYRSLWFQHAAARAEGTIVEISGGAPALTVEFRTTDGQTRRTESGGSDLNKGYAKGDKLTVFYDAQQPADARLDLWVENWLLPLITAVPGAIILLAMVLIVSTMRSRSPFEKPEFETGGTLVPAEFVRVRISPDFDRAWDTKRAPGDFTLTERNGRWELKHNGKERDPYDPAVQRDLGLCYVVEAKGKDPKTGAERFFESEPLDSNPERLIQGRPISVYVDPKRPDVYRMELPFQKKAAPTKGQASPITKL
ncbi:MAG TPA: DUF3592 domain-containing protein [Burkholderiales bacterium]|nr:DUF3592 domain-containing protein [Burkholderiales bacterium]